MLGWLTNNTQLTSLSVFAGASGRITLPGRERIIPLYKDMHCRTFSLFALCLVFWAGVPAFAQQPDAGAIRRSQVFYEIPHFLNYGNHMVVDVEPWLVWGKSTKDTNTGKAFYTPDHYRTFIDIK
jgi:hypothetical protein